MMQNYSKNPKPARNETKFNNTKKWRNHLDYTTLLIDSYFYLSLFFEELLHLLEVSILDVLRLWTFLLSLLLTTIELVATRLAGCATLLVHLL